MGEMDCWEYREGTDVGLVVGWAKVSGGLWPVVVLVLLFVVVGGFMGEKSMGSAMYWAKLMFDVELGSRVSMDWMLLSEFGSNECDAVVCGIQIPLPPPTAGDDEVVTEAAAAVEAGVEVGGREKFICCWWW